MTRTFQSSPAERKPVSLIIGLVGPSSSGKTWTALELATGIQSVVGGHIDLIDTEHERGLFYAENFKFNHIPFAPPFASLDYLDAIKQSDKNGASVIIVDSLSHEHDSEGGMIDFQDKELTRITRGDEGKRQAMQMLAWAKPKAARRKLLQGITGLNAHLIMCFRAKNTSKPAKDQNGKNIVQPMGFMPIAGDEFVFECALSMLFPPNAKGVPNWSPEFMGERLGVKVPNQFGWLRDIDGPITREVGGRLAKWAQGGQPKSLAAENKKPDPAPPKPETPAGAPQNANEWADRWDDEIQYAEDGKLLGAAFNLALKSDEWEALKENDKARASALKAKVAAKVKELTT